MVSKEENILLAAEKLFAEKGFDKTSTREISRAANVNISMISYYFGSKEKLLESLFKFRMVAGQDYMKEIIARTDLNEWQKITLTIERYIKRVKTLQDFYNIMHTEQLINKNEKILEFLKNFKLNYLKLYEELAEAGFKNKIFKNKPNITLLHATLTGTLYQAMNGQEMYSEYYGISSVNKDYEDQYFAELTTHIKQVLKNLLGYEENI